MTSGGFRRIIDGKRRKKKAAINGLPAVLSVKTGAARAAAPAPWVWVKDMRVITGSARGARLETLDGTETRPTADRVKEAVFSSLQFELEGRRVLDLFAGSGQLGIEALSRGASLAVFIDQSAEAVRVVRANLAHTRLAERARVLENEAAAYLSHCRDTYDIIFLDPPYGKGLIEALLPHAARCLTPNGVVVAEAARIDPMPQEADSLVLAQRKIYGKTAVGYYRSRGVETACL